MQALNQMSEVCTPAMPEENLRVDWVHMKISPESRRASASVLCRHVYSAGIALSSSSEVKPTTAWGLGAFQIERLL